MPTFFHFEDLQTYWMAESGKPKEEMPQDGLDVRDLREIVARATFQPLDWSAWCLVAPRRSVSITTQRMGTNKAPSAAPASVADDEPPPLEGDEPPPLEGGA